MQFEFSNKAYDRLKFLVIIVLPALATLYLGLASFWDVFQNPEKVAGSIALVATFLGTLLQISNSKYKGNEEIAGYIDSDGKNEDTGLANLQMYVRQHPDEILAGKKAVFKIGTPPPMPKQPELGEGE